MPTNWWCVCQTQTQEYHSIKSKRCENDARKNTISGWLLNFSCENWMWCGVKLLASYLIWRQDLCPQFSMSTRLMGPTANIGYALWLHRSAHCSSRSSRHRINNNCMLKKFRRRISHASNRNSLELLLLLALNVIVPFFLHGHGLLPGRTTWMNGKVFHHYWALRSTFSNKTWLATEREKLKPNSLRESTFQQTHKTTRDI